MLSPHFEAAAINLARLLEADGRVEEAIAVLDGALQPDEERIGLINQRARLLEQNKRLQEAEQELVKSLMIQPDQPDVIQHWLHVRQKMCCWGMLSDEIPGLSRDSMVLHAGPLSALALFDDVAQQRTINDVWIQRKTAARKSSGSVRHQDTGTTESGSATFRRISASMR